MARRSSLDPLFDEPQGPGWGKWVIGGGIVLVIGFIAYAAIAGRGDTQQGPVPIIRADETAWTRAPSEPGGMEIPNQDSTVFELMEDEPVVSVEGETTTTEEAKAEDKPVDESADKAGDKTVDEIIAKATDEAPVDTATDGSADKPVEESVDEKPKTVTEDITPEKTEADMAAEAKAKADVAKQAEAKARAAAQDAPYNPNAKPAEPVIGAAAASTGDNVTVRLGSVPGDDMAKARSEFARLQGLSGGRLSGASPSFEKVDLAGKGSFVRINARLDRDAATKLCDALSAKGAPCLILSE